MPISGKAERQPRNQAQLLVRAAPPNEDRSSHAVDIHLARAYLEAQA